MAKKKKKNIQGIEGEEEKGGTRNRFRRNETAR